jgi:hypothetical protein
MEQEMKNKIEKRNLLFYKNFDPQNAIELIKKIENHIGESFIDLSKREDIQVNFRVDESISPGKFKPDPLMPGGYLANSLTIRSLRSDLFVVGGEMDDLSTPWNCPCGQELDIQFWKLCPFCARSIKP